jgi:hypothetical protein
MGRDLAFQTLEHLVERGIHVLAGACGPKTVAAAIAGHLHPVTAPDARVEVPNDLHFHAPDPGVEALDLRELVFRGATDLVREMDPASLEDELHELPPFPPLGPPPDRPARPVRAPAWLTWSLAPHSPAEGFAAQEAV